MDTPSFNDESLLPRKSIERLIRNTISARIAKNAVVELEAILTEIGVKISDMAIENARHAGRKTIRKEDIDLAFNQLMKGKNLFIN